MILEALIISLKVVCISVSITLIISILLLSYTYNNNSNLKKVLEAFIIFPMFIPPSAIGFFILLVFGKQGFVGQVLWERFNFSIIFTTTGAVIASIIVITPIMYQSIKTSIMDIDLDIIYAAIELGATKFTLFRKIIIPLCKNGIINGIILSFARAFGEFGATILVAGNIKGKTQTIPMAMYYSIENNNIVDATALVIVVISIAVILMTIYNIISNKINNKRKFK